MGFLNAKGVGVLLSYTGFGDRICWLEGVAATMLGPTTASAVSMATTAAAAVSRRATACNGVGAAAALRGRMVSCPPQLVSS